MPEPDESRPILDQYHDLVSRYEPKEKPAHLVHAVDQNLAVLHKYGDQVGLNLRDPDVLADFIKAHALIGAWTLTHIHTSCTEPSCAEAADGHVRVATAVLGLHLRELVKLHG